MTIIVIYCDHLYQVSYDSRDLLEQSKSSKTSTSGSEQSANLVEKMSNNQRQQCRKKIVDHKFLKIANIAFIKLESREIFKCLMMNCKFTTFQKASFEKHLQRHSYELQDTVLVCELCKKQINAANPLEELVHLMESHISSKVTAAVDCERVCVNSEGSDSLVMKPKIDLSCVKNDSSAKLETENTHISVLEEYLNDRASISNPLPHFRDTDRNEAIVAKRSHASEGKSFNLKVSINVEKELVAGNLPTDKTQGKSGATGVYPKILNFFPCGIIDQSESEKQEAEQNLDSDGSKLKVASTEHLLLVRQKEVVANNQIETNVPIKTDECETFENLKIEIKAALSGIDNFSINSKHLKSEEAKIAENKTENVYEDSKTCGRISLKRDFNKKRSRFSDVAESAKRICLPDLIESTKISDNLVACEKLDTVVKKDLSSPEYAKNLSSQRGQTLDDVLVLNDDSAEVIDDNDGDDEWEVLDSWEESPCEQIVEQKLKPEIKRKIITYDDVMTENVSDEPKHCDAITLMPWAKKIVRKNYKAKKKYDKMMERLSLVNLFKCMEANCSFTTQLSRKFEEHIERHQSNATGTAKFHGMCSYCPFSHPVAVNLAFHIFNVHGFSIYQCPKCFYRCNEPETCYEHLMEHHHGSPNVIIQCPGPRRTQASIIRRTRWMREKHVLPMKCIGCPLKFYLTDALQSHKCRSGRDQSKVMLKKANCYDCIYCFYGASSLGELSKHMTVHPTEARYYCSRVPSTSSEEHLQTSIESASLLPIYMDYKFKVEKVATSKATTVHW